MKISLNWLRNYIDFSMPVNELVNGLTGLGIEVESVEFQRDKLKNFVIGKVIDCKKHPNADKLSVCKIDAGTGELLNIVCGAPNVSSGQTVCVALPGAVIPIGNFEIKKSKIRGEISEGMICSANELELSDDQNGIMVLDNELSTGTPFSEYLGQNDVILEIGITPNRGDLLSHIGIARELGALTGSKLKQPEIKTDFSKSNLADKVEIYIENKKGCLRYCGTLIEGITVKESPGWLKNYLNAAGLRPVNNVVDATNFVMFECGQPLHAFDYDSIADKKIIVKSSGSISDFTTLDGKQRKLRNDILLICDGKKPVALAGIMGGQNSEISNNTVNVFIESAYFDPVLTRLSSKFLALQSDSSYRFERCVDIEKTEWACKRAAELIAELGEGSIVNGFADIYPEPLQAPEIKLRLSFLNRISGADYNYDEVKALLDKIDLSCINCENGNMIFRIPQARREDLQREIDLVEEVIRLNGYDKIEIPDYDTLYLDTRDFDSADYDKLREIRNYVIGRGFKEVISNTLVEECFQQNFSDKHISLLNPSSDKMNVLRSELPAGMFEVIKMNFENSNNSLKLFETGNSFVYDENGNIKENKHILLVMAGIFDYRVFLQKQRNFDILDMASEAEGLLSKFSVENIIKYDYYRNDFLSEYKIDYKNRNNVICNIVSYSSKFLNSIGIQRPVIICQIPF